VEVKKRSTRKKRRAGGEDIAGKGEYQAVLLPEMESRPPARWLDCTSGQVHLVAQCPICKPSGAGLLLATFGHTVRGRVVAKCLDCGAEVDYYVEADRQEIWEMHSVEARRGKI